MVSNNIDNESIEPLLEETKKEHIISISIPKYKIKPEYNFVGNFKKFNNAIPVELLYYMTSQEYESTINQINTIVKPNKIPIIISIIFQLFIVVPLVFFALTNNLPFLYLTLGILILSAFACALISLKIQNKIIKKLEDEIMVINNKYACRNISFEVEKKLSKLSNKYYINLYICYPSSIIVPTNAPPSTCSYQLISNELPADSLLQNQLPSLNDIDYSNK